MLGDFVLFEAFEAKADDFGHAGRELGDGFVEEAQGFFLDHVVEGSGVGGLFLVGKVFVAFGFSSRGAEVVECQVPGGDVE